MVFYIVLWSMMAIYSFFDLTDLKYNLKKNLIFWGAILCTFLGGIRDKVGTDWEQYYYFFMGYNTYNEFFNGVYPYEYGYLWLNYLIKIITDQYNIFLLIFTGIICFFKYKLIVKLAPLPLIVFLLNFSYYKGDIFSVRQSLAISIIVFSLIYIVKKDLWKFLIIVLIATFFHRTSIIFLPAYWIYHKSFSTKNIVLLIGISILIGNSGLIEYIVNIFLSIDATVINKLAGYMENSGESYEVVGYIGIFLAILKKIFFIFIFTVVKSKLSEKYFCYNGLYNFFCFSCFIYFLFLFSIPEVSLRIIVYYNFFEIFLLSMLIGYFNNNILRIITWLILVLYSGIYFYYALNRYYELYVPYNSIFSL